MSAFDPGCVKTPVSATDERVFNKFLNRGPLYDFDFVELKNSRFQRKSLQERLEAVFTQPGPEADIRRLVSSRVRSPQIRETALRGTRA